MGLDGRASERTHRWADRSWAQLGCLAMVGVSAAACGPQAALPDVPLRSLCGQPDGRVQLLALDVDEAASIKPKRAADRWVFTVHQLQPDAGSTPGGSTQSPSGRIVSVDSCGNDLRTVVSDAVRFWRFPTSDEPVWLACAYDTGELWWFDPTSDGPARSLGLVSRDESGDGPPRPPDLCAAMVVTDDAVIVQRPGDDNFGSIVRVPVDATGPGDEEVIGHGRWISTAATAPATEVFVRDRDGAVVGIDVRSGHSEIIVTAEPHQRVRWSMDRIFSVYDPDLSTLLIVNGDTGEELDVPTPPAIQDAPTYVGAWGRDAGLRVRSAPGSIAVAWLPELTLQSLVGSWVTGRRVGQHGAVFTHASDEGLDLTMIDTPGAEPRMLLAASGGASWIGDEHLVALDRAVPLQDANAVSRSEEARDWLSVPLDGSAPTLLVSGVHDPRPLTGGDWATVRGFDDHGPGTLLVVHADGRSLGRLDDGVAPGLRGWVDREDPFAAAVGVMYFVPADEDRRGVWYAEPE